MARDVAVETADGDFEQCHQRQEPGENDHALADEGRRLNESFDALHALPLRSINESNGQEQWM